MVMQTEMITAEVITAHNAAFDGADALAAGSPTGARRLGLELADACS
jgi:hypothetical protein